MEEVPRQLVNWRALLDVIDRHPNLSEPISDWVDSVLDDPYGNSLAAPGAPAVRTTVMPGTALIVTYQAPTDYRIVRILKVENLEAAD